MTVIRVTVKLNESSKGGSIASKQVSVKHLHAPAYGKRVDIDKSIDTFQSFLAKCVEVLELEKAPNRVFD